MNISDRIYNLRKQRGISQEEFADKIGVEYPYIDDNELRELNEQSEKQRIEGNYERVRELDKEIRNRRKEVDNILEKIGYK